MLEAFQVMALVMQLVMAVTLFGVVMQVPVAVTLLEEEFQQVEAFEAA